MPAHTPAIRPCDCSRTRRRRGVRLSMMCSLARRAFIQMIRPRSGCGSTLTERSACARAPTAARRWTGERDEQVAFVYFEAAERAHAVYLRAAEEQDRAGIARHRQRD